MAATPSNVRIICAIEEEEEAPSHHIAAAVGRYSAFVFAFLLERLAALCHSFRLLAACCLLHLLVFSGCLRCDVLASNKHLLLLGFMSAGIVFSQWPLAHIVVCFGGNSSLRVRSSPARDEEQQHHY